MIIIIIIIIMIIIMIIIIIKMIIIKMIIIILINQDLMRNLSSISESSSNMEKVILLKYVKVSVGEL